MRKGKELSENIKIRFVVATRESQDKFFTDTAMGKSLSVYKHFPYAEIDLYTENTTGLSKLYNISIEKARNNPAILVFAHDDILITDYYWASNIVSSLNRFHIAGLAGNKRRLPNQPSWFFSNDNLQPDESEYLSGVVAHGSSFPPNNLSVYGETLKEVKLLDGLFLASHSQTLIDSDLRFDERFDFHFYDMDFCRSAELKNLKMGTLPLSVIHGSEGNFMTEQWKHGLIKYREKWGS